MALSLKACWISPTPHSHKQTSEEIVKPSILSYYPSFLTNQTIWSIPSENPFASPTSQHFHDTTSLQECFCVEQEQKLEVLKQVLNREDGDPTFEDLTIVDAIQRLGIEHHFREDIEAILNKHHDMSESTDYYGDGVYEVALRFRLLRQEGFYVPANVFDRFKNKDGKFMRNLSCDVEGLMGLYEASQLSIRGEDKLDEAGDYSYGVLSSWVRKLDNPQAVMMIESCLRHPYHKSLAMFMAEDFFRNLHGTGWVKVLKELAQFDFKKVQSQHHHEIIQVSKWWKELGLEQKLQVARDQSLKWYTWSMGCLTDPSLSEHRIELTKPISFIYIIDDIFNLHGTLNELTLFTDIVNRWDTAGAEQLPDYMKTCFKALDSITNEISCKVYKQHGWNPVNSLRKTWATLCNAFLVEAKWFESGHLPNPEEYLANGIVSSGVYVVLVHVFFLLGQGLNKQNVKLIDNDPGIISSTATIRRLWDDLGSTKVSSSPFRLRKSIQDEVQDSNNGSFVECYLKQHQGSSVEGARKHVISAISDAWKRLNEECLTPNRFSATFTRASLNIARMVPLMYGYDDNHRLPILETHIKSNLYENLTM